MISPMTDFRPDVTKHVYLSYEALFGHTVRLLLLPRCYCTQSCPYAGQGGRSSELQAKYRIIRIVEIDRVILQQQLEAQLIPPVITTPPLLPLQ